MRRGILADRDELRSLRGRISRKGFDAIYDSLRKRCALILESAPVNETQWRSLWQQGQWYSALGAARTTQGRIFDLTIAHHIDPNTAYRDRAIEELKNLIGWSTWVDPCHNHLPADLCTAEAVVAAVVGLDWLWEDLSEADRLRVLQAIRHKGIEPYRKGVQQSVWWCNCCHHWNAVVNCGCGLGALALGDDEPQAQEAYRLAREGLKHFFKALGREGGWDEGVGYWGYAMRYVLLFAEASSRLVDDQTIFHSRGMDATGLFPIYFTPNGHEVSFGDAPAVPLYGTFYLLAKHFGRKEVGWWLDTYAFRRDVSTTGFSAAGLAMLFRPLDPDVHREPQPDLKPVKVFNEIGWAAMADSWPRPGFYVAAKTGDLAENHSQRDMNSIQLQVDGEILLTDPGGAPLSREYFSDARESFYEVQARAHNTIVVAQRDHQIDAQGSIIEAQEGKNFRWITCDANSACGENVSFLRQLVMIVDPATRAGRMLIVVDELSGSVPERVDLFWHTRGRIEQAGKQKAGRIVGQQAELYFALASTVRSSVSVEEHRLDPHRLDSILHLRAGIVDRALFVSVFSREKLPGKIQLKRDKRGHVGIKLGRMIVQFKSLKRRLQLDRIVVK